MTIQRVPWSDSAAHGLSHALPDPIMPIVEQEVRAGVSMLWECRDDSHHAYCVTRVDANPLELVVVAFEGQGMLVFGPLFVAAAHARGLPIRAHVTQPAVERMLRRLGLQRSEIILRATPAQREPAARQARAA